MEKGVTTKAIKVRLSLSIAFYRGGKRTSPKNTRDVFFSFLETFAKLIKLSFVRNISNVVLIRLSTQ